MSFFGISARSAEQKAAMQALMSDKPFTFITGPAGCGKTLVSQAVGLEKVIEEQRYRKLIYTRMQTQVGTDLGALPGDINEKTYPFVAPFMDNLDEMTVSPGVLRRYLMEGDEDKRKIFFDPIQTIRGRSLNYTYLLSDETQNIDISTMAAIATRNAKQAKFVFIGNFSQIDTPKLRNPKMNGFYQLLKGLYDREAFEYFDHINFTEQQRHPVVTVVEEILRSHDVSEEFLELESMGNLR